MDRPMCPKCLVRPATVPVTLVTATGIIEVHVCSECAQERRRRFSALTTGAQAADMAELRAALQKAIEMENYEQAAVLRDAIKELGQAAA